MNEWQLPHGNIVAQSAWPLHYQYQDREPAEKMNSMLIDAGANATVTPAISHALCWAIVIQQAASLFAALLARMQDHQNNLISLVTPGANYVELQAAMHRSLAEILVDAKLLECSVDEAITSELTVPFCPHGLGHLLGIQVHDVGGQQLDIEGHMAPPPAPYASLRLTRPLSENMVITVEPGLYFIPMLLNEKRAAKAPINWAVVDLLTPFGGIRIEDNIRLLPEAAGIENLTRDAFRRV